MDNHLNENAVKYFTKQEVPITKEKLLDLLENMPDEIMWEDLMDRLILLQKNRDWPAPGGDRPNLHDGGNGKKI